MSPALRRLAPAAVALLVIAAATEARADTVFLKNGRRVDGRIIQESDREVAVQLSNGSVLRFERRLISRIERPGDPKPEPSNPVARPGETLSEAPAGSTEDEVERYRRLAKEIRETTRRVRELKLEVDAATKKGEEAKRLAEERSGTAEKDLERLKTARVTLEKTAQGRLAAADRRTRVETTEARTALDAIRGRNEVAPVCTYARDLDAKIAKLPAGDARRRTLREVQSDAWAAAGDLEIQSATAAKDRARLIAGGGYLAEAYRLAEESSPQRAKHRNHAAEALARAHRLTPRGKSAHDCESALLRVDALEALATLVEDRLGPRRLGALIGDKEGGRFRLELDDGRVVHQDEIPTNGFARVVFERREMTDEAPPPPLPGAPAVIGRARAERWYELLWDPQRKLWARDTESVRIDSRLPSLLREGVPLVEDVLHAAEDRERLFAELPAKREVLRRAQRDVDDGGGSAEAVATAAAALAEAEKAVVAADSKRAAVQRRLVDKKAELESVLRAGEQARRQS